MGPAVSALPDFPWDSLLGHAERARSHPDGIVDLSVGTPVDRTPEVIERALAAAADAPGYPTVRGRLDLREAVAAWFSRRRGVPDVMPGAVLPTIGSKEFVAWLPTMLGLGPGDLVVHPEIAYPTYDIGARLCGATPVAADSTLSLGPQNRVRLVWLNSPGNPTGRVLGVEHLAKVVEWARRIGAVVAADECYAELGWDVAEVPSLLDPRVCDGDHTGLLVANSLSKRSNLAGYRAAFVTGDPALIESLHQLRRHAGMMMPTPVQAAAAVALADDAHVRAQRARYARRRELLKAAVVAAGLRIDHSEAGLYLWATDPDQEDGWATVGRLADRGVLVAPGSFYGPAGRAHVRIALTATDERVAAAVARLPSAESAAAASRGTVR